MHRKPSRVMLTAAVVGVAAIGVLQAQNMGQHQDHAPGDVIEHTRMFEGVNRAVALLMPTQGNTARGVVYFQQTEDGKVTVRYRVEGLGSGSTHGFHVHEYGDLTSADGTSLGGHYDPEGHPHSLPHEHPRHAGDLGNIEANDQGVAEGSITVDTMTVAGLKNPIIGRGLVVHAQPDTGQGESGEAGARIAVGVIGVAQPQQNQDQ